MAERLFAERGVGTVSLREIVAEAGQRNKSVIQYHFGPAADLVEAVFEYRMGRVNARRLEVLAEMHAAGRATDLESLVEALVLPLVEVVAEPGCHYARFMAQFFAHPTYRVSPDRDNAQSLRLVEDGARRALPELSEEIFDERWRMVSHLFVQTIADHEGSRSRHPVLAARRPDGPDASWRHVWRFSTPSRPSSRPARAPCTARARQAAEPAHGRRRWGS